MSHEKINSGFVYGLRLAFPSERIRLYADDSHIHAIISVLENDGIELDNIEFYPVKINSAPALLYFLEYYFLIKSILENVLLSGDDKVFFLSFNAVMLYIIKKLKMRERFSHLKFSLVLHGDFETLAEGEGDAVSYSIPAKPLKDRLRKIKLHSLPMKILRTVRYKLIKKYENKITSFYSRVFPLKKLLLWQHTSDFIYIALSSHILKNAKKDRDIDKLNLHLVTMPTIFRASDKIKHNPYQKFAIFGYGNSAMLHQVLTGLSKLKLTDPYEIRIIGMNNDGIEGFSNVTITTSGNRLTRAEMEEYARDIDIFLILHPSNTYKLSCSASIFEALSYEKPILHFNNDCINTYNTKEMPIGICAGSIEEFVNNMSSVIRDYNAFLSNRDSYISNIKKIREIYSIEQSKGDIAKSFSWPHETERNFSR
jgi:hypothetical protein